MSRSTATIPTNIDEIDVLELYKDQVLYSVGDDGLLEAFHDDYCVELDPEEIV